MANLGSELIRFFNLQQQGAEKHAKASAECALHIIEKLEEHENIGNGRQEVAILKSILEDALSVSPQYSVSIHELNSYFEPFAARAMTP